MALPPRLDPEVTDAVTQRAATLSDRSVIQSQQSR